MVFAIQMVFTDTNDDGICDINGDHVMETHHLFNTNSHQTNGRHPRERSGDVLVKDKTSTCHEWNDCKYMNGNLISWIVAQTEDGRNRIVRIECVCECTMDA
eukprot:237659_1